MTKRFDRGSLGFLAWAICSGLAPTAAYADQATPFAYDSTGKVIGPIVEDGVVVLKVKGAPVDLVRLDIRIDGIGSTGIEFFAATDCSGPTYLPVTGMVAHAYIDAKRPGTIIVADPNATPTTVLSYTQPSRPSECISVAAPSKANPVQTIDVGQTSFKPPFSVQLR